MNKKYICHCGLYCENCAVKAKVEPAAKILYDEMKKAGFETFINMILGGEGFWPFLKNLAESGMCISCQEGSGNPNCEVRKCAVKKGIEICALCESYPCEKFNDFFQGYPALKTDNALLREKGMDAWAQLQDERRARGFTYTDEI